MKYRAHIKIMPRKELLDPQGKTIANNMKNVGIDGVEDVRMGKNIEMLIEAQGQDHAQELVEKACKSFLANVIMESYTFEVEEER